MNDCRLPSGGRIDRSRPIRFEFNGRLYAGFRGDTLASALLANGVHLAGRSFKYHRPRGILTAGAEEPNALVQLGAGARTEPNLRATQIELHDGLVARSVNAWPSVERDAGSLIGILSRLWSAGFYYKTFMWPAGWWQRLYEPAIRRMAGMGRAPDAPDPDLYDKLFVHCDVLVVGGGAAGLAAAQSAARTGARVILCDEQAEFGGALLASTSTIAGRPAPEWVASVQAELAQAPETTLLPRTTVFGYYDQNYLCAVERRGDHLGGLAPAGQPRQRLWHIRARHVVLATGAHERPLVFADNDRPGIMLAGAVSTYLRRYGVRPGRNVVVFTNNDSAYATARDLLAAGAGVRAIVDLRPEIAPELAGPLAEAGAKIMCHHAIVATRGTRRVSGVAVMPLTSDARSCAGPKIELDCDLVAMSGGWSPAVHLFSQSAGRLRYDEAVAAFVPGISRQAQVSAGAANGTFGLPEVLREGAIAGAEAAASAGFGDGTAAPAPVQGATEPGRLRPIWLVPSDVALGHGGRKHFVDFQNDVTAADIHLAAREGFTSVEHVKRYTTVGMGTDQGKTSNVNALAILSEAVGRTIVETGTTTFRAPYTPVSYGVLAGRDLGEMLDPVRVTPMHAWHVANGAVFEDVGQWKRPWYYPRAGEDMKAAVARECLAVRNTVGVLDASTLGKIEIRGPDAAEFVNRVYTNSWLKLGVGHCRYGLMCKQDGMVFDDGVTTRLGPDHFFMTTTTGGAARVADWLEEWLQTEWPELKVYCTSVTEQWATTSIAGPKSRDLLQELAPGMALDTASFPFMTMCEGRVAGIDARVFRISFTGELSFEINVPSWHGPALWTAVMEAGARFGITPYGTETMHVLRAEKGFIIVGQETDGTVTPFDLGMDWIVARNKEFIGRRSLSRSDTLRKDRKQLVGLLPEDPHRVLAEGQQLVAMADEDRLRNGQRPVPMVGHVTSSYHSANLGRAFALALVKGGRERMGDALLAPDLDGTITRARIVEPVFYDKSGSRRDG